MSAGHNLSLKMQVIQSDWTILRLNFCTENMKRYSYIWGPVDRITPTPTFEDIRRYYEKTGCDVPLTREESDEMLARVILTPQNPSIMIDASISTAKYREARAERMKALGA